MKKLSRQCLPKLILSAIIILSSAYLHHSYAQTGKITLTSSPSGALIQIDDREIGSTPLYNYDIKAGYHTIRLTDPSTNASTTRSIQVINDSLSVLNIAFGGSSGLITVESTPPGAKALLETNLGNTPIKNMDINPGAYSITLVHPRKKYLTTNMDVVIPENGNESFSVSLPKNRPFIIKTATRIALGVASIGLYAWGISSEANKHKHSDPDKYKTMGIIGFSTGTACLIGVEIISFF